VGGGSRPSGRGRSSNRLLKFDADGKELVAIDLGEDPFRVSVDPKDGSVWCAFPEVGRAVFGRGQVPGGACYRGRWRCRSILPG
jgi:hypothetical protein